jgi:hypothetical protein
MNIIETLKEVIADKTQPSAERARAASVLKFYSVKEQEPLPGGLTDDRVVAGMLARVAAYTLWEMPERYVIETTTGQDGITRLSLGRVKEAAIETLETPTPGPMPTFEPAVPLPVLPPSDIEKAAFEESFRSFDDRFSEAAVAARVAAIKREAAQIRASREQTK